MQVVKAILVKKYLHFHDPSLITLDWFTAVCRYVLWGWT